MKGFNLPSLLSRLPLPGLLCLGLLSLVLQLPLTTSQSLAEDLTILSAQGDGACVNVGGLALNCSLPFTLTVTVGHVALPIEAYQLWLQTPMGVYRYDPAIGNTTHASISFYLSNNLRAPRYATGAPLNVSLADGRNATGVVYWPSATAFSLLPIPLPTISSVTGCQSGNASLFTANCAPDVDVLTLTGVGFSQLQSFSLTTQVNGVGQRSSCCFTAASPGVSIANDTCMMLTLYDFDDFLFAAEHYSGVRLTVVLYRDHAIFGSFNLSMASLPPPTLSSVYVAGAQLVVVRGVNTFIDCRPLVSQLTVYGHFLFNGTLTVGGVACDTSRYGVRSATAVCQLPSIQPYVSGRMYDVQFTNDLAQRTLAAVISFTDKPTITSVSQCWSDGGRFTANGSPLSRCAAGDTLYLFGTAMTLAKLTLLNVTLSPIAGSASAVLCSQPTVLNASVISCVLPPTGDPAVLGQGLLVMTGWSAGYISNSLYSHVYDFPNPPRIFSIQSQTGRGTNLSSGLTLTNCQPGEELTLTGVNFRQSVDLSVASVSSQATAHDSWYCSPLNILSSSLATCQLPTLDEAPWLQPTVAYSAALLDVTYSRQLWGLSSNGFSVTFDLPYSSSSSSSSSTASALGSSGPTPAGGGESGEGPNAAAIIASVVVVAAVLLVAAGGGWWWFRVRPSRRMAEGEEDGIQGGEREWSDMIGGSGRGSGVWSSRKWPKMSGMARGNGANMELLNAQC